MVAPGKVERAHSTFNRGTGSINVADVDRLRQQIRSMSVSQAIWLHRHTGTVRLFFFYIFIILSNMFRVRRYRRIVNLIVVLGTEWLCVCWTSVGIGGAGNSADFISVACCGYWFEEMPSKKHHLIALFRGQKWVDFLLLLILLFIIGFILNINYVL